MTGVNIEFNVQDALDALINIEFALLDTHGLFNHISKTLLDIHEARFNTQESPDGIHHGKHYHHGIKKVSQNKKIKLKARWHTEQIVPYIHRDKHRLSN